MREPLTEAEKRLIYEQKMAGKSLTEIAKAMNCSYETARKWWRIQRDNKTVKPRGRPALGMLSTYPQEVRNKAVELKRATPSRGGQRIRLDLQDALELDENQLPSASRLTSLFRQACPEAVKDYQRRDYPSQPPIKSTAPHQLWQIDGKEYVPVGTDNIATVLDIRDPCSGVMIGSPAFITTTPKHCRKLSLAEVQTSLRDAFTTWGMPLIIQTDHENVYVGPPERYFPSVFTLWLVGLGIEHRPSRKRQPTDQGSVERTHRIQADWSWHDLIFETLADLQTVLDNNRHLYNERFPAQAGHCHGQPTLVAVPYVRHSGRPFDPALEWELFDLDRVDAFLAQRVWTRQVDDNGVVRIAGHRYYLGRAYVRQTISVTFLPPTRSFHFEQEDGSFIRDKPALGLDKADIIGRIPADKAWPILAQPFQLPLPLVGV